MSIAVPKGNRFGDTHDVLPAPLPVGVKHAYPGVAETAFELVARSSAMRCTMVSLDFRAPAKDLRTARTIRWYLG